MFYVDEEEMGIPDNEHKMYESKETAEFFFFSRKMWVVAYNLTRSYELENYWKTILGPYYRTFVSRTETQTLLQVIMHLL